MPVDAVQGSTGLSGGGTTGTVSVSLTTPINPSNITTTGVGTIGNVLTITAVGTASWSNTMTDIVIDVGTY
jgi:hypothetical protein